MPVATRRAALLLLSLAWSAAAQAQPERGGPPVVLEGHFGFNDPLGNFGLALVYDRGNWFSAGAGLGFDSVDKEPLLAASLLARARVFRRGAFAVDLGAVVSRGGYTTERHYKPPYTAAPYPGEELSSKWVPDYRATGTLATELANRRWSLRLETGLGYHLGHPTCHYVGSGIEFTGECDSPVIPDAYHLAMVPGRISFSLSLTAGYRFGVADPTDIVEAAAGPEHRSPRTALRLSLLSTAIPTLAGAIMVSTWLNGSHHDNDALLTAGLVGLGLGLGFGPSIGYSYAGEHVRGWGVGFLRLLGVGAGMAGFYAAGLASSTGTGDGDGIAVGGTLLFCTTIISAIYDVATAPRAAQRANARRGFVQLTLVPAPIRDQTASRPGLSMVGRF